MPAWPTPCAIGRWARLLPLQDRDERCLNAVAFATATEAMALARAHWSGRKWRPTTPADKGPAAGGTGRGRRGQGTGGGAEHGRRHGAEQTGGHGTILPSSLCRQASKPGPGPTARMSLVAGHLMEHSARVPRMEAYQALVLVSFGAPEHREDVMPFLRRVTAGRGIPEKRIAQVAEHYYAAGGASPLNARCRELMEALRPELADVGLRLYWGNRNWHPLLDDTLAEMRDDGVQRALAFVTSAYAGYSSCRQYLDDIASARLRVGAGAPIVDKLRLYYNHPGWVEPWAANLARALRPFSAEARREHEDTSGPNAGLELNDVATEWRRSRVHRPQRAHAHGCQQPVRGAADGDGQAGRRGGRRRQLAAGLAKPLRPAQLALAGARHPRCHRGFARQHGGSGADRFRVRQHGDRPRPRRGGGCGGKGKRRKSGQGALRQR